MHKSFVYQDVCFDAHVVREALDVFHQATEKTFPTVLAKVAHPDGAEWAYDELDEFFADYRRFPEHAHLYQAGDSVDFHFSTSGTRAQVRVTLPSRASIERVFQVFDRAEASSKVPPPSVSRSDIAIFIGHGRSDQWRKLGDHLHHQHGYTMHAYETGARAGHTIRDILEDLAEESSFAILVFTGEDEQADGQVRARQNVVHETGLFQGRLGFSRAIVLLEEGVEPLSNLDGVQHIPFAKRNIRETFGDVLATIRREFPA